MQTKVTPLRMRIVVGLDLSLTFGFMLVQIYIQNVKECSSVNVNIYVSQKKKKKCSERNNKKKM